jgi:hypothetical protein
MLGLLFFGLVLFHLPTCNAQDKLNSFFDPDESIAHKAVVVGALKQICPRGQLSFDKQDNPSGCRDCPHETTEWDAEETGAQGWDLQRAFMGHFASAGEEDLVLSGRGCEAHMANYGGSFIFAVTGSVPRLLRYNGALITEKCHKFRFQSSPDMLVCTDNWGSMGVVDSYVYAVKFGRDGESKVDRIFATVDKSRDNACGISFADDKPTSVEESQITAMKLLNPTGNRTSLSNTATFGERNPTSEEREACRYGAKPIPLEIDSFRMEFFLKGSTFRPSKDTKQTLKLFPKPEWDGYASDH